MQILFKIFGKWLAPVPQQLSQPAILKKNQKKGEVGGEPKRLKLI